MVKIGPRLPCPSRREIEKREKEQRRATQIESEEGLTEPCEVLEPAMQRKRARHRDIDDADLEDSKRKREKTLKRREARRLAKQAERELARREGSSGCVEDSLEFLLAELDRHYNGHAHQPSQTPIMRSEPQQDEPDDAGYSPILPPADEPVEGVATSLHSSPNAESDIHLPLVSSSELMISIDLIVTPEDPVRMQVTEPLEELPEASFSIPAESSEEAEPTLATPTNFQPHMPPRHSQNAVGATAMSTTVDQSRQDTTNWPPVPQLLESLSRGFSPVPVTMLENAAPNFIASGTTRPTEAPFLQLPHSSFDSSVNPPISSEPLNTSIFSSSSPSSAALNLQEIPRMSLLEAVGILPNGILGSITQASLTSQASSSSTIPSVLGSALTRVSHMDLGSTITVTGSSLSVAELSVPRPAAISSTRTRSTTFTSATLGLAQKPLAVVSSRPRAFSSPTVKTSGVMEANGKQPTIIGVHSPVCPSGFENGVQADLSRESIPEVNLPNDANATAVGVAITRRRVRSDTFSSNISDSANVEVTGLDGRVPPPDNDRTADEVFSRKNLFPCIERSSGTDLELSTTLLAPAAPIVDNLRRPPMLPSVPESASGDLSEPLRTTVMEVKTMQIVQTETVIGAPNISFSEPTYPDTPQLRPGIIPPYSTPTSQSPRIFTLELPSPRKKSKAAPILPIYNPHLSRPEEKSGSSIVYGLKWVLRKTFEYFFQGRG